MVHTADAVHVHMVFSTLHTKDSVGTVARLLNMNVEPFLLAAALTGVIAQRLVRVLCAKCKVKQMPSKEELERLGVALTQQGPFYIPQGCDNCFGLGYTGRLAIYEWLVVNRELRNLIIARAPADALKDAAKKGGLLSLQDDGMDKVYQGITSIEEVVRVTHEEEEEEKEEEEEVRKEIGKGKKENLEL